MRLVWLFAVLLLAAGGCGGYEACEREHTCIDFGDISYTNTTNERLFAHFGHEVESYALEPGETRKVEYIRPGPRTGEQYDDDDDFVAIDFYDERGCKALAIITTVRKIRDDLDSSFVVMPADLKPPQDRHDCELHRVPPYTRATSPAVTAEAERPIGFLGHRGVYATFAPADLGLYRALLPSQFDMPDTPLVAVYVADFHDVNIPWSVLDPDGGLPDMVPFLNSAVLLQCEYEGRTGSHSITMAANDRTVAQAGRRLGLPEYVADEITLEEDAGGWTGRVLHEGRTVLSVSFTPAPGATPQEEGAGGGTQYLQLVPPGVGPQVQPVDWFPVGEGETWSLTGMATIEADPEVEWAGLIPEGGVEAEFEDIKGPWLLLPQELE